MADESKVNCVTDGAKAAEVLVCYVCAYHFVNLCLAISDQT